MGIYITGAVFGTAGGLILGGALADLIGWRWTFVALGVPGILLGLILFLTVKEPVRGIYDSQDQDSSAAKAESVKRTLESLRTNKVFLRISLAWALITMIGYAIAMWLAPIMLRNFDISVTNVGLILGLSFLAGGIPGPIVGGFLSERLERRDDRWRVWMPAIAIMGCFSFYALCLTATSFTSFIVFFVMGYFMFMVPQGPTLSVLQDSLKPGERALGVSLALFVNNILGQVIGLFVIGLMSDAMANSLGVRSLNFAVLILCAIAAIVGCLAYLWTASAMSKSTWRDRNQGEFLPNDGVLDNG